jgi:hypothetical protein
MAESGGGTDVSGSNRASDNRTVEVDEGLEARLVDVESAVVSYLVRITETSRDDLASVLTALDADTSASDAFRSHLNAVATMTGMVGLGTSSLQVYGQTRRFPVVNQVPLPVFQAQVALVRAAKTEIFDRSPETLDALESTNEQLAEMRARYVS